MSFFYEARARAVDVFASQRLAFHAHLHSHVELVLAEAGEINVTVGEERHISLTAGQGLLISPNVIHAFASSEDSVMTFVLFSAELTPEQQPFFTGVCPACRLVDTAGLSPCAAFAVQTLRELARAESPEPIVLKALLMLLLADVLRDARTVTLDGARELDLCQRLLLYIDANLREELSLATLAAELHVSPSYISTLFSRKLHCGFNRYLTERRMALAENLLRSSSMSITALAYEAGFASTRTFNRRFLEAHGIAPSAYRALPGTPSKPQGNGVA
ncbi:MAG: AraC family transcriptional regulator [Clostridia bacterium]